MILKSLELQGFKSFVDSTKVDFNQGFTAIVGPNGCGKSNISDAIRWLIGEQSSKNLRGKCNTDLIFNGSDIRKPVNRTEIALTLSGVPSGLRIANVPNISEEIKVTRCFHRSGESEFYINEAPCRLKDITDLFLDLGISPKALSVIEQSHINHIVTSKPDERRILIEEAAGILKFKHRKNEALRKLAASSQNLERIRDIVQELARQVESLKRQAAKADRYKRYQAEIKHLSLNLFSQKIRKFQKDLEGIEAEFKKTDEEKALFASQVSTLENQVEQLKIEIDELSVALNQKKESLHNLSAQIGKDEHAVALKRQEIAQAEKDSQSAETEIGGMGEEIAQLEQEAEQQRHTLGGVSEEINEREKIRAEKNQALDGQRQILTDQEEQARVGEKEVLNLYQNLSQKKNEITALETRGQVLETRSQKLEIELEETASAFQTSLQTLDQTALAHKARSEEFAALQEKNAELTRQVRDKRPLLEEREKRLAEVKETFLNQSSLLNSLKELRGKFEGFQDGVKSLMAYNGNGGRLTGLREVLVDVLQTPEEYEQALSAVLGEKLQSVIVDSYNDADEAIDYLKSEHSGRGSFIPMQAKQLPQTPLYLNGDGGVIGKAVDFVQCKEEYRPLIERLLDNVVLVADFKTALHLHGKEEFQGVVVTKNGEVIDRQGIVTGGENPDAESNLLAKNREMEELAQKVDALKTELGRAETEKEQQAEALAALESQRKTLGEEAHQAEIALSADMKDRNQAQAEVERLKQKRAAVEYERDSDVQEMSALNAERERVGGLAAETENAKILEEERVAQLRLELGRTREAIREKAEEVSAVNVYIASLTGKRDNIFAEIKRIEFHQDQLKRRIEKRQTDIQDNRGQIAGLNGEIQTIEDGILERARTRDQLQEETTRQEEHLNARDEELKTKEQATRVAQQKSRETAEALSKIDLQRSELRLRIAHIQEKAYEDFAAGLEELLEGYREAMDETETDERLHELKNKVAKMGEVNLAALSDFEQTNERYEFLNGQEQDLDRSIKSLHEAIEKIDQTTRQHFEDTFHQVNESFKTCFERLFQGGRAELILIDPSNPLDSGIDIFAQPKGKKNQSINLLSQGEKAMTAMALMFAIFKVRPSPFCLLDEIDAPLDEANVIRFHDLLKDMSDETQFILITHNQKTMSFADVLYGVTMEERGVSKVVSVHLNN